MAFYYGGYPEYVSVAEKKAKALKAVEKLKKKNPNISPVIITGKKIASTWWGKSWNDNLERYSDYSNRIGRGRSYVRHGSVLDLQINNGLIKALVQGSRSKPYKVDINIKPLLKPNWENIKKACEGKLDSLQELMEGKFPKALKDIFVTEKEGLFPSPDEITFDCSCPDWADMCKHVAAVLYGVGARLDERPEMFFILRNVNMNELVSEAISNRTQTLLGRGGNTSSRVIDDADILDIFGIEMLE